MQGIHNRMPVILARDYWASWLDRFAFQDLTPEFTARPVSRRVNAVANDDPECLDAGEVQTDLSLFPDSV